MASIMANSHVAAVRAFNRFYTRQIGLLGEHVAASRYTLTEGRLLYELGTEGATSASGLAASLGLDPAYLSRLLKRLVRLGLVVVAPSATDRRRNDLALTDAGRAEVAELDRLNDVAIESVLEGIDDTGRQTLAGAMAAIRATLGREPLHAPVILRPHRLGEIGWLIHRQAILYNHQFGWNIAFEALIAGIYSAYQSAVPGPGRNLWVAEQGGAIAGSIFVEPSQGIAGSAQLRMLYVEPAARGQGVGSALVGECVRFARDAGYERMRLWTHTIQQSARRIYAAAGFAVVETIPEEMFGKTLTGEIWEMRF